MMRSLAVVALAASAAGACVEIEDIASYASAGTQYCSTSAFSWCKDVSCFGNAGTWARLGYATCKADSSDNLCGATTSNCGDYGINKATMDCDCVPGDDDGAVMPAGCDTSSSSSSTSTSTSSSSGSSSQTSNDDVVDDDKKMTLVVLAGLLGLSLAAGLLLFALRQQQLAAKKPRAPRTFTVTAVQSV